MAGELIHKPYEGVVDLTNIPNEYQGALRFAYMDFDLLTRGIRKDLKNISVKANVNVAFTCLDQLDATAKFTENGFVDSMASSRFLAKAKAIFDDEIPMLNGIFATSGLTRREIIQFV
jgi:adenylosuccinate synthase